MQDATKEMRVQAEVKRFDFTLTPLGWVAVFMAAVFLAGFVLGIWWGK